MLELENIFGYTGPFKKMLGRKHLEYEFIDGRLN